MVKMMGWLIVDELKAYTLIRRAGFTGLILSAVMMFGILIIPNNSDGLMINFIIFFALAYGVYAKSRICASLLLGYFTYVYILNVITYTLKFGFRIQAIGGIIFSLVVCYFLIQGVRGTFVYYKLNKEKTVDI